MEGLLNTITVAHSFVKQSVKPGDLCIDATMGRGYDTAFLCELTGTEGKVIAFDVQKEALESTKVLLDEKGFKAELILESHTQMAHYAEEGSVSCIMFNFGYLPGADHTKATKPDTSVQAIEQGLTLLKKHGIMSLCVYHGGDTGFEEKESIMAYLKTLDSKKYIVIVSELYNRPNYPPLTVLIRREK